MIFKRAFIYFLKIFWGLRTKDLRGGWITGDPAHSKHLHTSDEDHAWVYENKSRAGHSINFQWEWRKNRFKHWPCWGLPLIFFFPPLCRSCWWAGHLAVPLIPELRFSFLLQQIVSCAFHSFEQSRTWHSVEHSTPRCTLNGPQNEMSSKVCVANIVDCLCCRR